MYSAADVCYSLLSNDVVLCNDYVYINCVIAAN